MTPYGAPGAPTGVSATFSNGTAEVKWNAPSNTNGRSIEQYTVSAEGADPVKVDAPSTSTSFKLEALRAAGLHQRQSRQRHKRIPTRTPRPRRRPPCGPFDQVNAPRITSLEATGNSKEIAFNVEFQPGNGWSKSDVVDYQWTPDGVHWDSLSRDGDHTVTSPALTDGVDATLQVKVTVRKERHR